MLICIFILSYNFLILIFTLNQNMNNLHNMNSESGNMIYPSQWNFEYGLMPNYIENFLVKIQHKQFEYEKFKIYQSNIIEKQFHNVKQKEEYAHTIKIENEIFVLPSQIVQGRIQTADFNQELKSTNANIKIQQNSSNKKQKHQDAINSWTREEEQLLIQYVRLFGKKWKYIATLLQGKSVGSIKAKYMKKLCPETNNKWNEKQNQLLMKLIKQYGHSWKKISSLMSKKTPNQVKNQYYGVIKKKKQYQQISRQENNQNNTEKLQNCDQNEQLKQLQSKEDIKIQQN